MYKGEGSEYSDSSSKMDRDFEETMEKNIYLREEANLKQALADMENAPSRSHKFYVLTDAALSSAKVNKFDLSKQLSEQLLVEAEYHKDDWNYGNA